jgi:DHA1 family tetracycline resistance protein-like MFS transporter
MTETSAQSLDLRPWLLEAFLCSLAMMSFVALLGPMARTLEISPWHAGAVMSVGGLTLALFARGWGRLSDRWGRRRVLLLALAGFAASHLAMSGFVIWAMQTPVFTGGWAFAFLLVFRALSGAFYAAVPTTGAAWVADHAEGSGRAKALAGLGAASGMGMIAGPGLIALTATQGLAWPLVLSACAPWLAWLVMWRVLPRNSISSQPQRMYASNRNPGLWQPAGFAFVAMLCVSIAQTTVGFYALDRLQLDAATASVTAGVVLTGVGFALVLAQLLLRSREASAKTWVVLGAWVAALGFGCVVWADHAVLLCLGYFVAAIGMGWVFPSVTAWAADSVAPEQQGMAAGTVAAAHGAGMVVGPVMGTAIYEASASGPYVFIAVAMGSVGLWRAIAR